MHMNKIGYINLLKKSFFLKKRVIHEKNDLIYMTNNFN